MKPILTYQAPTANNSDWASQGGSQTLSYTNQINQNQGFAFVGPAVSESKLIDNINNLGLNTDKEKGGLNYSYAHNDQVCDS